MSLRTAGYSQLLRELDGNWQQNKMEKLKFKVLSGRWTESQKERELDEAGEEGGGGTTQGLCQPSKERELSEGLSVGVTRTDGPFRKRSPGYGAEDWRGGGPQETQSQLGLSAELRVGETGWQEKKKKEVDRF